MGFSFHGKKREVDSEKHLRRLHKTVPFIESPLTGADHEHLVFSQRHEANTVELFFDLFFVANLATFTAYHSITDTSYLLAYVGFFGILWSSWFQVTLHDVRFARDSIYERVCKTIQFIVFVGLALVGSAFKPGSKDPEPGDNTNFRILCYTLVLSRGMLAVQYVVVLYYCIKAKANKLNLPIGLIIVIYVAAAAVFAAMTPAFREKEQSHRHIYLVWYAVMLLEAIGVIAISCCWRMLSFKKTHLMERMSLLTLIVIGEGAIGVTKTVSRLMGKSGLDVEGCFLIMCIIMVLVLLWALYFDNFPHGHYGTIRQQIWSILHFPFQLGIVGVVEGSQQVATARYVLKTYQKTTKQVVQYCVKENLDGAKLRDTLQKMVDYFQFDKKLETYGFQNVTTNDVWLIGNTTGICSPENSSTYENEEWPKEFVELVYNIFSGVFNGLGMKIPVAKLEEKTSIDIAEKSWKIVYLYYWISFCTVMACSIAFLFLIRRHKADLFDFVSVIVRMIALAIGGILIALIANTKALYNFIASPAVLPTCLSLLFLVLLFDRVSGAIANWQLKKSGQPYAKEVDDEHHHGGHDKGHGYIEEIHDSNHDSYASDRKSAALSSHPSESSPLTSNTAYHGDQGYAMTPLMSPPLHSPPVTTGYAPGGYMPVTTSSQHYGA
ncbi:uncharacterized protein BDR25DRAFT_269450 [Lindgomyces ingoldianus]|uniref:Uncharacterized protein n=1 Tax=Lindgomyces ingoldianus TaxID=673940 RepID=A0ACB6QIA0_9PLEO|nr:uncharacterized protein BDR25DRAFT_269450 [Lindgomyces ingoldianus]KAF2465861.1 hypothetical protein BDR25DRAFT_269450 [Lindgomyces ingoldianus]